ncbi:hypothetical protein BN871_FM_00140 [Paenibacillus sp. P22]|nr:hypothetical protein BN871_FM_00140 [Paenibacillus sp. P22]
MELVVRCVPLQLRESESQHAPVRADEDAGQLQFELLDDVGVGIRQQRELKLELRHAELHPRDDDDRGQPADDHRVSFPAEILCQRHDRRRRERLTPAMACPMDFQEGETFSNPTSSGNRMSSCPKAAAFYVDG